MRLPVFFRRVSSIATGTNRPAQWAKAVGRRASKSACSSQSLRACKRYSALPSCWSNPKPARMRVSVAVPMTVNEPSPWRRARRKLRSCRNTGRHRKRSARKRFSNTAGESRLYLYQGSPTVSQLPLKMSKLQKQHTVLLEKEVHLDALDLLRRHYEGQDRSDLLNRLLKEWVKRHT